MHEFAERGVASHWQYKSSEKFNSLSWKEYDWLKDLVEIIEKNENPEDSYEYTKLQMFQENVFCFFLFLLSFIMPISSYCCSSFTCVSCWYPVK